MEINEARTLAIVLMTKHGLMKHGYKFQWDNRSSRFGAHSGPKRIIFLSKRLTFLNDEEEVKDTILHEIAHALDYIRNGFCYRYAPSSSLHCRGKRLVHDEVWKDICREIGCKPHRCYTDKEVTSPTRKTREVKWHVIHKDTGEVCFKYKRRPNRKNWERIYIEGRKSETLGKLILVPV